MCCILGYSLVLQAGYRASDLSLVYPIARGTGPLLSFVGAAIFLGEQPTALSILGLVFIVAGILLVAGPDQRAAQGAARRNRVRAC